MSNECKIGVEIPSSRFPKYESVYQTVAQYGETHRKIVEGIKALKLTEGRFGNQIMMRYVFVEQSLKRICRLLHCRANPSTADQDLLTVVHAALQSLAHGYVREDLLQAVLKRAKQHTTGEIRQLASTSQYLQDLNQLASTGLAQKEGRSTTHQKIHRPSRDDQKHS